MKGYYKNWYQYYLEVEKQKEKELQRGYYSNLAQEKGIAPVIEKKIANVRHEKENDNGITHMSVSSGRNKKNKLGVISFLLPIMTILGFAFLWYQMDIGPIRGLTHDVLSFARLREDVTHVVSYHTILLDQHTEFVELIATYVADAGETDFETLQLLYDEIQAKHLEVAQVSDDHYDEVIRLWSIKLLSTSQMMDDLLAGDDIHEAYAQFVSDQAEISSMIRMALR